MGRLLCAHFIKYWKILHRQSIIQPETLFVLVPSVGTRGHLQTLPSTPQPGITTDFSPRDASFFGILCLPKSLKPTHYCLLNGCYMVLWETYCSSMTNNYTYPYPNALSGVLSRYYIFKSTTNNLYLLLAHQQLWVPHNSTKF